jgi:hypothetical protein
MLERQAKVKAVWHEADTSRVCIDTINVDYGITSWITQERSTLIGISHETTCHCLRRAYGK